MNLWEDDEAVKQFADADAAEDQTRRDELVALKLAIHELSDSSLRRVLFKILELCQ